MMNEQAGVVLDARPRLFGKPEFVLTTSEAHVVKENDFVSVRLADEHGGVMKGNFVVVAKTRNTMTVRQASWWRVFKESRAGRRATALVADLTNLAFGGAR